MKVPDISGIIPPLVTPLTSNLELDREGLTRLIEHMVSGGVQGIFLLGSTGEGSSLNGKIRSDVIRTGIDAAGGRVPVFVNITTPSYLETLQLAEHAAGQGADVLVAAPPFYFGMTQEELATYMEKVADQIPLPLLLYNAPQYTGVSMEAGTVVRLSRHEKIVGIKDSSGDMIHMRRLIKELVEKDFALLVGEEVLLKECLKHGCDGGVTGGANMFPSLYVNLFKASSQKKTEQTEKWQGLIHRVQQEVYHVISSPAKIILGIKYVLSVKGICSARMAMPIYEELTAEQKKTMEKLVAEFDILGI